MRSPWMLATGIFGLLACGLTPKALPADTCPLFRHDARTSGASLTDLALPLDLAWRTDLIPDVDAGSAQASYVVADEARAYVATFSENRAALRRHLTRLPLRCIIE
jgi:hypothetical protein